MMVRYAYANNGNNVQGNASATDMNDANNGAQNNVTINDNVESFPLYREKN